jgi:hypothetical protein
MTKEKMVRTVLGESWRRNEPVGPSPEVIDDDDNLIRYSFMLTLIYLLYINQAVCIQPLLS